VHGGVWQIAPLDAQVFVIDPLNDFADRVGAKVVVFNRIPDLKGQIALLKH
jgi:hypothetical protein